MALHLKIENVPNLPDGGPIEVTITGKRGIDIGRDSHLDWTLPDPTRHISGKHAEIRYKEGGYWLHDVSTNGTFLNAETHRMQAPRRLRTGDRFTIGHYIIAAAVEGEEVSLPAAGQSAVPPSPGQQDLWSVPGDAAPPIDPKQLRAARDLAPVRPDFLDWAADVPSTFENSVAPQPPGQVRREPAAHEDMDWARGERPPAPQPPPPPPTPAPRRPAAAGNDPAPAWQPPPAPQPPPALQRPPVAARAPAQSWDQPPAPQRPASGAGEPAPAWDQPPRPAERSEPPARPALQAAEGKHTPAAPSRAPAAALTGRDIDEFVRALARAAGVPEQVFTQKDPQAVAEQLGQMLRLVVDNLSQLLNARVQAKRLVRSASHTVIQATDNNPLKFSPSAEEALRIMFGPSTRSYLDAQQALLQGFEDIKTHQVKTYSAMQHALTTLLAELDPQTIDKETEADRGIAAVVGSRKARLWDAYVARWQAKQRSEKGGLIEAFMQIFAQYYDERRP